MNTQVERLRFLYGQTSKHSNYQILPECLKPLLDHEDIQVKSRYEKERMTYMLQHIDPRGRSILDIGGNSGYFSFELIGKGAEHVDYYEGNLTHAEFVKLAASLSGYASELDVFNRYYDFSENSGRYYDIALLLNVLHHVGDDYGAKDLSIVKAKEKIIDSLNFMADKTAILIFQLGFCWQGNRELLLFENGTKEEMVNFIKEGTKDKWTIEEIAVPEKNDGLVSYEPLNNDNMLRQDGLGEFLNRPIFIMRSH